MKKLTVYIDSKTPNQRVYQVDEGTANKAFFDMLDSFRGAAFQHDLGIDAGSKPKYNIPNKLQAIDGVGTVAFKSPNYIVFKHDNVNWDNLEPKIHQIFTNAFGKIERIVTFEGSLP